MGDVKCSARSSLCLYVNERKGVLTYESKVLLFPAFGKAIVAQQFSQVTQR
jgi:hypothetical protein